MTEGLSVFKVTAFFKRRRAMASKAKTIGRAGPGKPATVEKERDYYTQRASKK
jgi:hypothetical protein